MSTVAWIGDQPPVDQVDLLTVGGTFSGSEVITLTINNKNLVITLAAAAATTTEVAEMIAAAINAANATESTDTYSETRNVGGQEIAEFSDLSATQASNVVTVTATVNKPFTLTSACTGVGTVVRSSSVAYDGPNNAANGDNWIDETGTRGAPVNGDLLVFDSRGVSDCLYGLNLGLTSGTVECRSGAPQVGLPAKATGSNGDEYWEYQPRYLDIAATSVIVGLGDGQQPSRFFIDTSAANCTFNVIRAAQAGSLTGDPAVKILCNNVSATLAVIAGSVGIADEEGQTSTLATVTNSVNGNVDIGSGVTVTNVVTRGGETTIDCNTTSIENDGGTLTLVSGVHTAVENFANGTLIWGQGTITTLANSGIIQADVISGAKTVTNKASLHRGCTVNDPLKQITWSAGFQLVHCDANEVALDLGADRDYTVA